MAVDAGMSIRRLGAACCQILARARAPVAISTISHNQHSALKTMAAMSRGNAAIQGEFEGDLDHQDGTRIISVPNKSVDILALPSEAPVFYKRTLPETCVDYTSAQGKEIFRNAMQEGFLETFFAVSSQFRTQEEPAFCGLSTLVVVLNALSVDPGRVWKGAWRWYSETMLECCVSTEYVKEFGITFDQFECLAMCNSLAVQSTRADEGSVEDFRRTVQRVLSRDDGTLLVASYDRGVLGQTGTGHFSPLAGYSQRDDMVLVMDVARFKYNPHWVPLEMLWTAMHPIDHATKRPRGYMVMQRHNAVMLSYVRVGDTDDCCVPELLQKASDLVASTGESEVILLTDASAGAVVEQLVTYMVQCDCAGLEAVPPPHPRQRSRHRMPASTACCTGACSEKSMVRPSFQENGSAGGEVETEAEEGDAVVPSGRVYTEAELRALLETLPHVMAAVRRALRSRVPCTATCTTSSVAPQTTDVPPPPAPSTTGTAACSLGSGGRNLRRGCDSGASGGRDGRGDFMAAGTGNTATTPPTGAPDVQLALLALAVLPYTENTLTMLGADTAQRLKPVIQEICAIRLQMENVMAYRKARHARPCCDKGAAPSS
eukprot:m.1054554 g.1054554  ORF g.1054554 m.1054554 type:complete len:602 (-) comp24190_c0_seq4:2288-4093(-)